MRLYFVEQSNQSPAGPFTKKQLREDLTAGRWPYDIKVCVEGESQWHRVDQIPQLAALLPAKTVWLKLSTFFCALSAIGYVGVVLAVILQALQDGHVSSAEATETALAAVLALVWIVLARGVFNREVKAYRRARVWLALNIALHVYYVVIGRIFAIAPIPFEVMALVSLYLARSDFNL